MANNAFAALDSDESPPPSPPTVPYVETASQEEALLVLEAMYTEEFSASLSSPTGRPHCHLIALPSSAAPNATAGLHIYVQLPALYPREPLAHIETYEATHEGSSTLGLVSSPTEASTLGLVSSPACSLLEKLAMDASSASVAAEGDWDLGEVIRSVEEGWRKLHSDDDDEPLVYDRSEAGSRASSNAGHPADHPPILSPQLHPKIPKIPHLMSDHGKGLQSDRGLGLDLGKDEDEDDFSAIPPPPPTTNSRYLLDFHELALLGTGGGGSVYSASRARDRPPPAAPLPNSGSPSLSHAQRCATGWTGACTRSKR